MWIAGPRSPNEILGTYSARQELFGAFQTNIGKKCNSLQNIFQFPLPRPPKIASHVADGLLREQVLNGINRAVGDEFESQQAPIAGVAEFIREEDGGVEGGQ